MRAYCTSLGWGLLALICVTQPACDLNPFFLSGALLDAGLAADADPTGDGGPIVGGDGGPIDGDGGPTNCIPSTEICDGLDNDCDGTVDNEFNLDSDPQNCGSCGTKCALPGTDGSCNSGTCVYECLTGYEDPNGDLNEVGSDGCEYLCTKTVAEELPGMACNQTDDDCDTFEDEHIDLFDDNDNCGSCGNLCRTVNSAPDCEGVELDPIGNPGVLTAVCLQGPCNCDLTTCYQDVFAAAGCEYLCPVPPTGFEDPPANTVPIFEAEVCDGEDNDCSGAADDNLPDYDLLGNAVPGDTDNECHPYLLDGDGDNDDLVNEGSCNYGTWICSGTLQCVGYGVPAEEDLCGGGDEDCDGIVDEDADLDNDPDNCGSCGTQCGDALPFTQTETCEGGLCKALVCEEGHTFGGDNDPFQGCDYPCTPDGNEVCDGRDNDCDELTDDEDDDLDDTNPGSGACRQLGGCGLGPTVTPVCGIPSLGATTERGDLTMLPDTCAGGASPVSDNDPGWFCPYDTTIVEVDAATCAVVVQETECDGDDNDCDAAIDEVFDTKGDECFDTLDGICQSQGIEVCKEDESGLECDFEHVDANPGEDPLEYEKCNGLDDDCDGDVDYEDTDSGVVDDSVAVSFTPALSCGAVGAPCNDASGFLNGTCFPDVSTCTVWVDTYEASRRDATSSGAGGDDTVACSNPNVIPWYLVNHTEAAAACDAAGKRLCSQEEWQLACGGTSATSCTAATESTVCDTDTEFCNLSQGSPGFCAKIFPYGTELQEFTCNTKEWNSDCLPLGADDQDEVFPSGFGYSPGGGPGDCAIAPDSSCLSDDGVVDMSGNLREWTSTPDDTSYEVRGGSYTETGFGATCDNGFVAFAPATKFENLGFRCCRDEEPASEPAP